MLRYKVIRGTQISVPLETKNNDFSSSKFNYDMKINPIVNFEKNTYKNSDNFSINFYFYDKIKREYDTSLTSYFDFKEDINRNVFKKSNIVFEFYEQGETLSWLSSESLQLRDGRYKEAHKEEITIQNPNSVIKQMVDFPSMFLPIFDINKESISMNELYFYRDFSLFKDIVNDEARIFMRAIMQNAKNGQRYYFVNAQDSKSVITNDSYSFYHEIRVRRDNTYYFVHNNNKITSVDFKEMIS